MSAPEWSPGVPVTIENLEPVFFACLNQGDAQGVEQCIRLACVVDPHVASNWYDSVAIAVQFARSAGVAATGDSETTQ